MTIQDKYNQINDLIVFMKKYDIDNKFNNNDSFRRKLLDLIAIRATQVNSYFFNKRIVCNKGTIIFNLIEITIGSKMNHTPSSQLSCVQDPEPRGFNDI